MGHWPWHLQLWAWGKLRSGVIHWTCKVPDVVLSPPGVDQSAEGHVGKLLATDMAREGLLSEQQPPRWSEVFQETIWINLTKDEKSKRKWILRQWKPGGNSCLPKLRGTGPVGAKAAAVRWEQRACCIMEAINPSVCLPSQAQPITSYLLNNDSSTNSIESLKKALNKNAALLP